VDCLIENAFYNETILALWGRRMDPRFAPEKARAIFYVGRAPLPPANATFRLVWFLGKRRPYHNQAYIRFNLPLPEPLRCDNAWDRPRPVTSSSLCLFLFKLVSRSLKRLLVSVFIILFFFRVH